ncbi:MAG: glycosyltransferase family 2 protein [Floccifex sp.]
MVNNICISVIIPVYNVEKYIQSCIKSVIDQTYSDIEILLVDDGSTDKSGIICDEYAACDSRITVVHQKNAGLSAARNRGISEASCDYITFIDSDDYIAPDYIERLYRGLLESNAQICICDYKKVDEEIEIEGLGYSCDITGALVKLSNKQALENVYTGDFHGVDFISVAKLYDKRLFLDNGISFPVGKIHEDAFTTYKLLYLSERISYVDKEMYFYRIRRGSITTSAFSIKKLDKLEATRGECDFFLNHNEIDLLRLALFDHLHEHQLIIREMNDAACDVADKRKVVCQLLQEDLKKYGKYVDIPLKKRVFYKLLAIFPQMLSLR